MKELLKAIDDLAAGADGAGCSENLVVVYAADVRKLIDLAHQIRSAPPAETEASE